MQGVLKFEKNSVAKRLIPHCHVDKMYFLVFPAYFHAKKKMGLELGFTQQYAVLFSILIHLTAFPQNLLLTLGCLTSPSDSVCPQLVINYKHGDSAKF